MKSIIRSMRGEMIDMGAMASSNASTIALGNASMNARGDLVDKTGNVLKAREVIVQEYYNSNPKSVTQRVSLKDIGDEVLTPQEVIAKLEGTLEEKKPVKRRKVVEDED